ncbi:MAG: hypothetical protein AAF433_02265 [Bacteroidota bacterium]
MTAKPIILYQQTPLIHFQGTQRGATLRASEVKPKLDRWLKAKLESSEEGKEKLKRWSFDENSPTALNYRLRIVAKGENLLEEWKRESIRSGFPNFFAELGDDPLPQHNYRVFTLHEQLALIIESPHDDLIQKIKAEVMLFFHATNFGSRVSKGFGSFLPAGPIPNNYAFAFFVPERKHNYKSLFRHIEILHRSIRTGLNCFKDFSDGYNESFYQKPLIFEYARTESLVWEKKVYKEKHGANEGFGMLARDLKDYENGLTPKEHWPLWYNEKAGARAKATVRDALGLSTNQSWGKYPFEVKKESERIKRAPSPFTFVPVKLAGGFGVYVYARQPEAVFLNHSFKVSMTYRNGGDKELQLKPFPGFQMRTFLQDYFKAERVASMIRIKRRNLDLPIKKKLLQTYSMIEQSLDRHEGEIPLLP